MLSAVLNSPQAVQVSIQIVRSFIELRRTVALNTDLGRKLASLEKKYDRQFRIVFDAIRELMTPPAKPKRRIGFKSE